MGRFVPVAVFTLALALTGAQSPPEGDLVRRAATAYEAGDVGLSIQLYRQFLAEHPHAAEIRSNLAAALIADSKVDDAIEEYRTALKSLPGNRPVMINLALAFYKVGRYSDTIHTMTSLETMQPLETPQSLLLADCLLQVGEPGRAAALLKPLEEYSDDRALTYMLGMALLRDNRTDEAQTVLNQILGEGDSAEGSFLLGQLEYLRQNLAAAERHLAQAVKLNPKLPGAHSLYGQVLRSLSKLDEATEQFRAELEVNPYDFTANVEAAMLRKQEGEYEEALAHIARALQARPTDPGVRLQRASIRLQQGLFDEARQDLETLLQEYPDFSEAHATLAMVYYRLGRKADGDRAREAAMRTQQEAENQLEDARRRQKP